MKNKLNQLYLIKNNSVCYFMGWKTVEYCQIEINDVVCSYDKNLMCEDELMCIHFKSGKKIIVHSEILEIL